MAAIQLESFIGQTRERSIQPVTAREKNRDYPVGVAVVMN
jgi:hypothetical protein